MKSKVYENLKEDQIKLIQQKAHDFLGALIQEDQYVGELYSISYEYGLVQIHDRHRMEVGGIPGLSFLIATRIKPGESIDYTKEDSSIILLRVMDAAPLPNASEIERIRVQAAQRATGEDSHWDEAGLMDGQTANLLSFAGVKCRVIGTFYLELVEGKENTDLAIRFGGDLSNYYPNRGLKVYKPNAKALEEIVNYSDPTNIQDHFEKYGSTEKVKLGQIRYASTNRKYQQIDNVPVYVHPADLLSQKSALFGMTRTGKSNTTKIIAKAIFELRNPKDKISNSLRIGQIIFDPNGEYANENVQDNNNALKNIWEINCPASDADARKKHKANEVVTYGISAHPNDPERKMMLLNFYVDDNLQIGKEIVDNLFSSEDPVYLRNFSQVVFELPDTQDWSAMTRYRRRVLAYRAILNRAGFTPPANISPNTDRLFNPELVTALNNYTGDNEDLYHAAAGIFSNTNPSWGQIADAFESLDKFIRDGQSTGYSNFENWYVNTRPSASGERWADEDFKKLIGIFQYPNGIRRIGRVANQHTALTSTDYAIDIYNDLKLGRLVIVDQSSGDSELNEMAARRIMRAIFEENKKYFTSGKIPPEIIVFVEEAHNLLPPDKEKDYKDIWVRTAKEGAKLRLGLVYATQEVSSIQKNILKNTANWFIAHLNNTDETKELCKYYDFADFEPSIRRAQDKGFLRVKTLSNPFVIPVQIDKFEVK